ncbi:MAG: pitrilysin family protein, partial [Gallionella sp.]
LFVEDHNIPMLDVSVNFAAGSSFDAVDKAGVASLTRRMLALGVAGMSEDDIASGMADIGAVLGGEFGQDMAGVSVRTLSRAEVRDQALDIAARVLQTPVFPEDVLAREKTRTIAALKDAETKPNSIAGRAFKKAIYGNHPYGLVSEVESVEKITVKDIQDFYQTHYNPGKAVVAIMGDVSRQLAEKIAEDLTAKLPASNAIHALPEVVMQIAPSELRIEHPATQSHILIGSPGMSRTDADYMVLYVGNYILGGGGFVSRLMEEVREKRGLAYSVYSYFMPMKQPGIFQIGLQTKKEQANEALLLVRKTLSEFIEQGPTEKELQAAKDNIMGGFPLRINSNRKIIGYLGVIGFYDLPLTYLDDFTDRVEKVSVEQIQDAFSRRINPEAMATVIVGAPEVAAQ